MTATSAETERRGVSARAANSHSLPWLIPVVVAVSLAGWQLLVDAGVVPVLYFSRPSDVVNAGWVAITSGRLLPDAVSTMASTAIGLAIGGAIGLALGLALGMGRRFAASFEWMFLVLNSLPRVTLAPMILVMFGLGMTSKIFIAVLASSIPIALLVATGVRELPPSLFLVADSFELGRWGLVRKILLQGSLPNLLTGLKLGSTRALLSVVVTEMFNPHSGLGRWISVGLRSLDPAQLIFTALLVALFGAVVVHLVGMAETRLLRWR